MPFYGYYVFTLSSTEKRECIEIQKKVALTFFVLNGQIDFFSSFSIVETKKIAFCRCLHVQLLGIQNEIIMWWEQKRGSLKRSHKSLAPSNEIVLFLILFFHVRKNTFLYFH